MPPSLFTLKTLKRALRFSHLLFVTWSQRLSIKYFQFTFSIFYSLITVLIMQGRTHGRLGGSWLILDSVLWLHADYKQGQVGQISSTLFFYQPPETNRFDLICQWEIEKPLNNMWQSYLDKAARRMPFSLSLPAQAQFQQRKKKKKSNLPCGSTAVTAGELNITHNSLGCWAGQRMAGMVTSLRGAITKDFNLWLLQLRLLVEHPPEQRELLLLLVNNLWWNWLTKTHF